MNYKPYLKRTLQEQSRLQPWLLPETSWGWYTSSDRLETLSREFMPISLKEMDSVTLLNRVDIKYVMPIGQLMGALAGLKQHYRMLSVSGQRLNHYRTLYFDTPDFELYNQHVNGFANRYKVRSREYTDSSLSFLEVKHKTPKDRTIKSRIPTPQQVVQMTQESENWLQGILPESRSLEPKLWNTFTRITLVSSHICERVTLDVDLSFYTDNKVHHLDGIAVAEVKMDVGYQHSPFLAQMRTRRIFPQSFSKYCIGVAMMYDHVKKNAMKPRLLQLQKMIEGVYRD